MGSVVGKAVCLSTGLMKISGPAEPITTTLFFKTATGERRKAAPLTISSELHQNFEKVLSFFHVFFFHYFFSPVYCFDSNGLCGCVAVCRLELNAAD